MFCLFLVYFSSIFGLFFSNFLDFGVFLVCRWPRLLQSYVLLPNLDPFSNGILPDPPNCRALKPVILRRIILPNPGMRGPFVFAHLRKTREGLELPTSFRNACRVHPHAIMSASASSEGKNAITALATKAKQHTRAHTYPRTGKSCFSKRALVKAIFEAPKCLKKLCF